MEPLEVVRSPKGSITEGDFAYPTALGSLYVTRKDVPHLLHPPASLEGTLCGNLPRCLIRKGQLPRGNVYTQEHDNLLNRFCSTAKKREVSKSEGNEMSGKEKH